MIKNAVKTGISNSAPCLAKAAGQHGNGAIAALQKNAIEQNPPEVRICMAPLDGTSRMGQTIQRARTLAHASGVKILTRVQHGCGKLHASIQSLADQIEARVSSRLQTVQQRRAASMALYFTGIAFAVVGIGLVTGGLISLVGLPMLIPGFGLLASGAVCIATSIRLDRSSPVLLNLQARLAQRLR